MSSPFSCAEDRDRLAAEAAEPGDDRLVLAEFAVAGERLEIGDQPGDVVLGVRPVGMARDLRLLPGRQPAHRCRRARRAPSARAWRSRRRRTRRRARPSPAASAPGSGLPGRRPAFRNRGMFASRSWAGAIAAGRRAELRRKLARAPPQVKARLAAAAAKAARSKHAVRIGPSTVVPALRRISAW